MIFFDNRVSEDDEAIGFVFKTPVDDRVEKRFVVRAIVAQGGKDFILPGFTDNVVVDVSYVNELRLIFGKAAARD